MDIIARLKVVEEAERDVALGMDMRPEDTANYDYAETCRAAAIEIERLRGALATTQSLVHNLPRSRTADKIDQLVTETLQ